MYIKLLVCGKVVLINKALDFKLICANSEFISEFLQDVWVLITEGCVSLCLKIDLYIVRLLLLNNMSMYFYGIIVTKLQLSVI